MKVENNLKASIVIALTLVLATAAAANNATYQFEAFSGTIDSSGDLTQDSTNLENYSAAIYDFETSSFDNPESFYTKKRTGGKNLTLNFNISDNEKRHYGIYFYKSDSEGENEYITYEYILTVNKTGNNIQGFNNTLYNTTVTFAKKTGASSNITLEQFDELAAGDPVHVGVNITAESPLDHTDYTGYVPDGSEGGVNLTEYYQTEVRYSLNTYNLTNGQNSRIQSKEKSGTVTIDFGDYERLKYTTIYRTGYYNITGETDPTADPKIKSGSKDTDFEEVEYLSKIKTVLSRVSNRYTRVPAEAQINLKDNLPATEADIAEEIEYVWLNTLDVGESLVEDVQGEKGLDAVSKSKRDNYTVVDSGYLPFDQAEQDNGDWYLCHRAWVEDSRSIITKGETSCSHFMLDGQDPKFSNVNSPTGKVTYSETGFNFGTNVSDNIQLEEVSFYDGLNEEKTFTDIQNPSGENSFQLTKRLEAGSHTYEWRAKDKVMKERGLSAANYTESLVVNPLPPKLDLILEDSGTGNSVSEVYWNDTVEVNVSTVTSFAPLGFSSNFTGWNQPSDGAEKGSYSEDVSIDEVGNFSFEARAGHNNQNYTEETDSEMVEVKEIPTDANITLIDENGNEISSAGLMENITVRVNPQADLKNSKTPVNVVSNLSLSEWNKVQENGVYTTEIQMKEEGIFQFNMTAGDKGQNKEGFTSSSDTEMLTVSTSNGGQENLSWSHTIQDQEIMKSESFSYTLESNYTGTDSDLTWNVLNSNFSISTGSSGKNVTVRNATSLEVKEYQVPVEVYDSKGNYLSGEFNVTVNPDLYWVSEPSDQKIDEGSRFSENYSSNVAYYGDKSNLTWKVTQNSNLFKADSGLVEDTEQLSTGTYDIGLNISDESNRSISTTFSLEVESTGDGGGSSSSGGGSSGTYSSSSSVSFSSTDETEVESVFVDEWLDIALTPEGNLTRTIRLDGVNSEVNVSSEGSISQAIILPEILEANRTQLQLKISETAQAGNYSGNIVLAWDNETRKLPITLEVEETEIREDLELFLITEEEYLSSEDMDYTVRADLDKGRERYTLETRVKDGSSQTVFTKKSEINLDNTAVKTFTVDKEKIEEGEYTITAELLRNKARIKESSQRVNVGSSTEGSITGSFTSATSGIIKTVISILRSAINIF